MLEPEDMIVEHTARATLTLTKLGQAAASSLKEEMDRLEHDPFQQGYQKGYQQAQRDIRMAMGCKA